MLNWLQVVQVYGVSQIYVYKKIAHNNDEMFKLNDNQAIKIQSSLRTTIFRSINFQNLKLIKSPTLMYKIHAQR